MRVLVGYDRVKTYVLPENLSVDNRFSVWLLGGGPTAISRINRLYSKDGIDWMELDIVGEWVTDRIQIGTSLRMGAKPHYDIFGTVQEIIEK
jgi:hypothetical protein